MPYLTTAELKNGLPDDAIKDLTEDVADAGMTDAEIEAAVTARIADAVRRAEGRINGYLSARYAVPLDNPMQIVKEWVLSLTIYNLYGRRQYAPDRVRDDFEYAIKEMNSTAKTGIPAVVDETGAEEDLSGAVSLPQVKSSTQTVSRTTLAGL